MKEHKILELQIDKMRLAGDIEKIIIPMTISDGTKESEIFMLYDHLNKSFYINSMFFLSNEESNSLLHIIKNDVRFEMHRARIEEFIIECSIEKPIPDLIIIDQYQTNNGDVKIYFTGEGINHSTNIGYVYIYRTNKEQTWTGEINSTYFGYSKKVIDIIYKKSKLYLLMTLGEQFT